MHGGEAARQAAEPTVPATHLSRRLLLGGFILTLVIVGLLLVRGGGMLDSEGLTKLDVALLTTVDTSVRGGEVALPHHCNPDPDSWVCERTYRFHYQHDPDMGAAFLYLPHFGGSVRMSLNGMLLKDSSFTQPSPNISRAEPLLAQLPTKLLKSGDNELTIDLHDERLFGGFLGPIYIGPVENLREHYNFTRFITVTLPRLIDGWMLAMGAFLLLVGVLRPSEKAYLIFGVILLLFAISSMPATLVGMPADELVRLANICRLAGAALLLPFVCQFVGRPIPLPFPTFLLLPILAALCVFVLPGDIGGWLIRFLIVPAVLGLALAAIAVLVAEVLRKGDEAQLLLLGSVVMATAFCVHDLLVFNGVLDSSRILLSLFSVPVVMLAVGGGLILRSTAALAAVEGFNVRLQQAVHTAEDKLRETFAREKAQSHRAALEVERVRMMRDLHDGLGGQLVSILSLSELDNGSRSEEITEASRRALNDLRLMVNSLEDVGGDLGLMLGMFRERIEPQVRAAGMTLDWRLRPLPDLPGLTPTVTLTIFRILQEAVTNAVRHSCGTRVSTEAEFFLAEGYCVRLTVRDNGHGGICSRFCGLGIASMKQRSAAISARLTIDSSPAGTAILLDLPSSVTTSQS